MKSKSFKTVEAYFSTVTRERRGTLQQVREAIKTAAPQAEEVITYNMPGFRLNGYLVAYAAYKNHIGFYPGAAGIAAFREEISKYQWAKGSVRFPLDKPMPLALIRKIVRFRVKQNLGK